MSEKLSKNHKFEVPLENRANSIQSALLTEEINKKPRRGLIKRLGLVASANEKENLTKNYAIRLTSVSKDIVDRARELDPSLKSPVALNLSYKDKDNRQHRLGIHTVDDNGMHGMYISLAEEKAGKTMEDQFLVTKDGVYELGGIEKRLYGRVLKEESELTVADFLRMSNPDRNGSPSAQFISHRAANEQADHLIEEMGKFTYADMQVYGRQNAQESTL